MLTPWGLILSRPRLFFLDAVHWFLTPSSGERARRAGVLRDRFLPTLENGLLQHTTSACGWYRDRRGRSRVVSETDCRLAVAPAPTSGAKP